MKSKKTQRNSIKRRFSKKYRSLKSRGGNQAKESGLTISELEPYLKDGLYYQVLMFPRGAPSEKHTAFHKITSFEFKNNNMNLYPKLEAVVPSERYDLVDEKSCVKYSSGEVKCNNNQKYAVKVVDINVENKNPPRLLDVVRMSDEDKKKHGISDSVIKKYQDKYAIKKIKVLERIL